MTDDDYVAELRSYGMLSTNQAADRIEQLTAERDVAIKWWGEATELVRQARLQYSEEKARAEKAEAERDRLREALNQCRLAFSGYVSVQSAINLIDRAALTGKEPSHE